MSVGPWLWKRSRTCQSNARFLDCPTRSFNQSAIDWMKSSGLCSEVESGQSGSKFEYCEKNKPSRAFKALGPLQIFLYHVIHIYISFSDVCQSLIFYISSAACCIKTCRILAAFPVWRLSNSLLNSRNTDFPTRIDTWQIAQLHFQNHLFFSIQRSELIFDKNKHFIYWGIVRSWRKYVWQVMQFLSVNLESFLLFKCPEYVRSPRSLLCLAIVVISVFQFDCYSESQWLEKLLIVLTYRGSINKRV